MKRYLSVVVLALLVLMVAQTASAQKIAIKTNVLYDVTTTMNIGVEYALSPNWTVDVSGSYNPWTFSENKKWKHWLVQPEARYWLCEKFNGHFFGVHLQGGQFNIGNLNTSFNFFGTHFSKLKDARFEGWFLGTGLAYGYAWMLNKHWNLEMEIGFGYSYVDYDEFYCPVCADKRKEGTHHYVGPTKAALNLVYVF